MYHRFEKLQNYIEDNEFRLTLFEKRIHVMNYQELLSIGNEKIVIQAPCYKVILIGNHLILSKMLEKELLISGRIEKVEISYEK